MSAPCEHARFTVIGTVNRLSDTDGGPVTSYSLDVQVRCEDCSTPFKFIGLPLGLDLTGGATMSFSREEAHLVISPDGSAPTLHGVKGFTITERSGRG